ncbi:hypothetical protein P4S72_21635 [Vibrio sp. PP-XX7]
MGDLGALNLDQPDLAIVITNSHGASGRRHGARLVLRAGYPCYDRFGNMDIRQLGYEGIRERLFALATLLVQQHGEAGGHDDVAPHISQYRFESHEVTQKCTV